MKSEISNLSESDRDALLLHLVMTVSSLHHQLQDIRVALGLVQHSDKSTTDVQDWSGDGTPF